MSEEEKEANDLIEKFRGIVHNDSYLTPNGWAKTHKQCALILCNEMIDEHDHETHDGNRWEYWVNVKSIIESK